MATRVLVALFCLGALVAGCGSSSDGATNGETTSEVESGKRPGLAKPIVIRAEGRTFKRAEPELELPSNPPPKELVIKNVIPGVGPRAKHGDELTVEYVGIHYDGSWFTNSWERSSPFGFELGGRAFSPGWEKGIAGMRVGERRELIVPVKELDWGDAPVRGYKMDEPLVYVVDLVSID